MDLLTIDEVLDAYPKVKDLRGRSPVGVIEVGGIGGRCFALIFDPPPYEPWAVQATPSGALAIYLHR